jgi:hypothetical protein
MDYLVPQQLLHRNHQARMSLEVRQYNIENEQKPLI